MNDLSFAIHNVQEILLTRVSEPDLNHLTGGESPPPAGPDRQRRREGCGAFPIAIQA